jgi:hypothetical protein
MRTSTCTVSRWKLTVWPVLAGPGVSAYVQRLKLQGVADGSSCIARTRTCLQLEGGIKLWPPTMCIVIIVATFEIVCTLATPPCAVECTTVILIIVLGVWHTTQNSCLYGWRVQVYLIVFRINTVIIAVLNLNIRVIVVRRPSLTCKGPAFFLVPDIRMHLDAY